MFARGCLLACTFAFVVLVVARSASAAEWVVGGEDIGWTSGAAYQTMLVKPGDTLKFKWTTGFHDLWQMPDDGCDWSVREGLVELADTGDSPFVMKILPEHVAVKRLFFACSIGSHCNSGGQNLVVDVVEDYDAEEAMQRNIFNAGGSKDDGAKTTGPPPSAKECDTSKLETCNTQVCKVCYSICKGSTERQCSACETACYGRCDACFPEYSLNGTSGGGGEAGSCDLPVPVTGEPGVFTTSCISEPVPMSPGHVVDSWFRLPSPYPLGQTVRWLDTKPDIVYKSDSGELVPVPLSELYVHHFTGGIEGLGEGAEYRGKKHLLEPGPNGEKWAEIVQGKENNVCNFHLIDIRGVEDWLSCVECRCQDGNGTYLDEGGANEDSAKGGIYCCDTCPSTSTGGVREYFLTYTVKWGRLETDTAVVSSVSLDVARALDRKVEHDIKTSMADTPESEHVTVVWRGKLTANNGLAGDGSYDGPKIVRIVGCQGHQHIGGRIIRLINDDTGEEICRAEAKYGTEAGVPGNEQGFLVEMTFMNTSSDPIELPHDLSVRLESIYENALHIGVMSLFRIYYDTGVTGEEILAPVVATTTKAAVATTTTTKAAVVATTTKAPTNVPATTSASSSALGLFVLAFGVMFAHRA